MSDKKSAEDLKQVSEMIDQLTESAMSDTMGLHMPKCCDHTTRYAGN